MSIAIGKLSAAAQIVHDAIALMKGDVSGHEFRGNQYSGGGGGTHGKELSAKEMASARVESSKEGHTVVTDAGRHGTYESKTQALQEAARLVEQGDPKASGPAKEVGVGDKVTVLPKWRDAGDENLHFTAITEPNATGHFKARVEDKIKTKDSFPSVMELHTTHIEEKFKSAKKSDTQDILDAVALQKGDVSGHEFHGNQYSGGGGGKDKFKNSTEREQYHANSAAAHLASTVSSAKAGDSKGAALHAQAWQEHQTASTIARMYNADKWKGEVTSAANTASAIASAHQATKDSAPLKQYNSSKLNAMLRAGGAKPSTAVNAHRAMHGSHYSAEDSKAGGSWK